MGAEIEEMMDVAAGARKIALRAGRKEKICTCGTSKELPYCDNSHRVLNAKKGTSYKSLKITPCEDIEVYVMSKNWE